MDDIHIQGDFINPAVHIRSQSGASCAVINGGDIFISDERGILPLIKWMEEDDKFFIGTFVADKIIGKAAAHILLCGGAAAVHGCVMSRGAFEILNEHGCIATYDTLTEQIVNRSGNGMCPMEKAVYEISDSKEAWEILRKKVSQNKETENITV